MGGFTKIVLKDKSCENIKKHNEILKDYGVAKKYSFYSEDDVKFEYDSFVKGLGVFPEHLFPKDKINSYNDFTRYWSTEALGEVFIPKFGTLTFDCYFGRTSQNAMSRIGRYFADHVEDMESVGGSWDTFMERGMTKLQREVYKDSGVKEIY